MVPSKRDRGWLWRCTAPYWTQMGKSTHKSRNKKDKNILFLVYGGDNLFFYCSFTRFVWVDVLPFESLLPKCREKKSVRGIVCDRQENLQFYSPTQLQSHVRWRWRDRTARGKMSHQIQTSVGCQPNTCACCGGVAQGGSSIEWCVIPSLLSLPSQLRNLLKNCMHISVPFVHHRIIQSNATKGPRVPWVHYASPWVLASMIDQLFSTIFCVCHHPDCLLEQWK